MLKEGLDNSIIYFGISH